MTEDPGASWTPGAPEASQPAPPGPPGSRIFSLEDRAAPSLYLIGWIASGGGLAIIFVALVATSASLGPWLTLLGILVLGVGLTFAAGYQQVARATRPADAYRGPSPPILFGIVLCISTIASVVLALLGLDATRPVGFLAAIAVVGLSYLVVVRTFVVRGGALRWSDMGWPAWRREPAHIAKRIAADIGYAIALIIPTTFAALFGGGLLAQILDVRPPQVLPDPATSLESVAVVLAAVLVAPIGEELFFRGFALTAWWRDLGPRRALIRSAVFFALVHTANIQAATFGEGLGQALVQVAVILPLGLVIGLLFLQRGMAAAMTAHIGYNGLLLLIAAFVESSGFPPPTG